MSKVRQCPNCGQKVPADMRFCGRCGADLEANYDYDRRIEAVRPVRRPDEPRPVETARMPERRSRGGRRAWQYILVVLVILAVIAAAIWLVIRMNQPVEPQHPVSVSEPVHVINADGEEITATATPAPTPAAGGAAAEATPEPEETPEPEATPAPEPIEITEANETVYVTGASVNLRTGPGTSYDVAATVTAGTELLRTGVADGWSRVIYVGKEYYISSALVTTEAPDIEPTPAPYTVTAANDTVVVTSSANIRTGPGTAYDVVGTAAQGTELSRTGRSNGWSEVVYNGQKAFIYDGLVEVKGSSSPTDSGTLTVKTEANIRSGPSTNDEILGVAKAGDTLETTGKTDNHWYIVKYNGQTAYINGNMVNE